MHLRCPGSTERVARRHALTTILGLSFILLPGCADRPDSESSPAARRETPDIFLITVDTLRADRLGAYGYDLPTSPFIDRLAAEGVRFEHAYSTSSWTVPSLVSMLTSSYPRRHGMGERSAAGQGRWHVTPSDLPSLPEALRAAGYRTYGFSANFGLPAERGFSRGFDRYRCIGAVDTEQVHRELVRWLPDLEAEGPWFLWLHLFDTHAPYTGREPWLSELYPSTAEAALKRGTVSAAMVTESERTAEVMDRAAKFYDSEIRQLDDYLQSLFASVPRTRDAFVLFAADHGEEFLDHGGVLHGRNLYDETTRIPFVVRFPDRRFAGRVVQAPVSLVDVLPTVLGVAGVKQPAGIAGIDLAATLLEPGLPHPRSVFAEIGNTGRLRAASDGRWKYIVAGEAGAGSQLFDLESDPGETHNVAPERPELDAEFRRQLASYVRDHVPPTSTLGQTEITPDQAEALKTLGYIQ